MDKSESRYRVRLKTFTIIKCAEADQEHSEPITTARLAARYLFPFFKAADAGREHFAAIYLDAKRKPICAKILFSGTTSEAVVYPLEVARAALLLNAPCVIVAHNHPSGDLVPSAQDVSLTARIRDNLRALDLQLLDSLVLSAEDGRFRSIQHG